MIDERLLNYYDLLDEEFHQLMTEIVAADGKKHLHAFRVNLKKQLALMALLPYLDKKFPLRSVRKPYLKLRKKTGKLRDVHVKITLIRKEELSSRSGIRYLRQLKKEEAARLDSLKKFLAGYSQKDLLASGETIQTSLAGLNGRIDLWVGLSHYFFTQLDQVRQLAQLIAVSRKVKPFHQLRTTVKALLLNLQLLQLLVPQKTRLKRAAKQFDDFQDLLGEWHDYANVINHLKTDKKRPGKALRKVLKQSKKRLQERILFFLKSYMLLHLFALDVLRDLFSNPPFERRKE